MSKRYLTPLLLEEQAGQSAGFTHVAGLTADDLNIAATNTVQDITLFTLPKGWIIGKTMVVLVKPFKNSADAAYNTTTLIVGDAGSSNRYVTSAELNANGTIIPNPQYNATAYQVTADTAIVAELGSQSGKSLKNLNVGEVAIFFQILDTKILAALQAASPILVK